MHVFDRFHGIKRYNDKLRAFHRSTAGQKLLKGVRWLVVKNPENLDPTRQERRQLERALRLSQPLAIAYDLKEDLRQIWLQPNRSVAHRFLKNWIARARSSGIRMLDRFADTLKGHPEDILNDYRYRISTGPLEGTNNKIQLMKRRAYGFRDHEFFKRKILGAHETRYESVG